MKSKAANLPAGNPITNQSISWAVSRLIMQGSRATNFNLNTKMCLVTVACSIGGCGDCPLAITVTEAVGLAEDRCGVEDGDVCG